MGAKLTDIVSLRLSDEDKRRLDQVAARVPVLPRLTIARLALRIGLQEIARDPVNLLRSD